MERFRPLRRLIPLLVLAFAAGPAPGAAASQIEIVDYGFYDVSVEGTVPAPEDISGERNVVANVRLHRQAEEIDAQLGRSFGFRFRIADQRLLGRRLVLRTIFPPLTNPASKRTMSTQDREFFALSTGETYYDGYRFDYDWEMAEGIWTFQILADGKVIGERKFKVIIPLN